ncbi:hypothetical protein [Treponema sp.]|uniref:hypothetical protein n=1 Tax=Treponema sp. TaxID=166 RepID=UPI003F0484A1
MKVEAWDTKGALLARKSASVKVKSGETAECSIALILLADKVLDTQYLLWCYNGIKYCLHQSDTCIAEMDLSSSNRIYYDDNFGLAEDINGNFFYTYSDNTSAVPMLNHNSSLEISDTLFKDSIYYDDSTDSLWILNSNSDSKLCFSRTVVLDPSSASSLGDFKSSDFDFTNKTGTSFAVRGNIFYFAYLDNNDSCYYLQRATISENDTGVSVTLAGSAKSVEQLGFYGEITDIAILYDGTVYVLVSNVSDDSASYSELSITYNPGESGTYYSRGALLKIENTSSGFEVVDSLGWTEKARTVSPVGDDVKYGSYNLTPSYNQKLWMS